jgi:hypothetical protein
MHLWNDHKVEQDFRRHPAHNGMWNNVMDMQNYRHPSLQLYNP